MSKPANIQRGLVPTDGVLTSLTVAIDAPLTTPPLRQRLVSGLRVQPGWQGFKLLPEDEISLQRLVSGLRNWLDWHGVSDELLETADLHRLVAGFRYCPAAQGANDDTDKTSVLQRLVTGLRYWLVPQEERVDADSILRQRLVTVLRYCPAGHDLALTSRLAPLGVNE